MGKYLYGASVQGIQGFIFETNNLKTIIGASEIIKNINTQIDNKYKENIVINAAGNVKLIFDESEKFVLEELVLNFTKNIKQNAFGITISQAVVRFEKGELKKAFKQLEKNLMEARNKAEIPLDMALNITKLASKTAKPMVENNKDRATLQKEKAYVYDENFGEISKVKNKKNKIAIVHADGNGLGAMIASLSKDIEADDDVKSMYKKFSENLKEATDNAIAKTEKSIKNLKLRKVIVGGDDLTVICDANSALEFTKNYLCFFERETKKIFGNDGLTACAGIAYCNHKYPFHYAVNLAESLCVEAKKYSKKINATLAPSSLVFHNIQSSKFTDYQEYIDSELTLRPANHKEIFLNYSPYFIREQDGYSTVQNFINFASALGLKGSPMSRLRDWLTLLGQDFTKAEERLKRINEMMDLRDNIYKKSALVNALEAFNSDISIDTLMVERDDGKLYSPIDNIDTYLSVIDGGKR